MRKIRIRTKDMDMRLRLISEDQLPKVLVLDVDRSVEEALRNYGIRPTTVQDPQQAIALANQFDFVFIERGIADVAGPDGDLAARTAFAVAKQGAEPILMHGFGYDPAHNAVKMSQAGLKNVIYKPLQPAQLENILGIRAVA